MRISGRPLHGEHGRIERAQANGTRNMLKASVAAGIPRFLYISTDGVYRYHDLRKGVTEESPVETHFGPLDYYRRAKTAAEKIARRYQRDGHAVSIVRPALTTIPRLPVTKT